MPWCAKRPTTGKRVLTYVERCPGTTAEEMAAALGVTPRRLTEVTATLVSVGLLRQRTLETGRRYAYFPGELLLRARGVAA